MTTTEAQPDGRNLPGGSPQTGTPADPRIGGERAALGLVLLASLLSLVRFHDLGRWSLWIDEVYTLADSLHGDEFRNPIGYWAFAWALEGIARPNEFDLRWLPALLGCLSIPLSAWALRPAVGALAAAAGALFVSLSSWHVFWSQTADFYTLALCLSLLGSGLVLRSFWSGRWPAAVVGLGLTSLAVLAHPSAVFLPPALVVAPWLLRIGGKRLPGLEGRLRWILLVIGLAGALGGAGWMLGVWRQWLETLKTANPAHFVLTTGFYLTPLLGAAAAVGCWRTARSGDAGGWLAASVAAIGLAGALVASIVARVSAQYVFCLLPWVAALAGMPLRWFTGAEWKRVAWVAILALPLAADLSLYFSTRHGERPRWKEAYRFVWNERLPDEQIFGMAAPVGEYYLSDHTDVRRIQRAVSYLDTFRSESPSVWARYDRGAWFVLNREELEDWAREEDRAAFEELLADGCTHVASFPVRMDARDIDVDVYHRPARR